MIRWPSAPENRCNGPRNTRSEEFGATRRSRMESAIVVSPSMVRLVATPAGTHDGLSLQGGHHPALAPSAVTPRPGTTSLRTYPVNASRPLPERRPTLTISARQYQLRRHYLTGGEPAMRFVQRSAKRSSGVGYRVAAIDHQALLRLDSQWLYFWYEDRHLHS